MSEINLRVTFVSLNINEDRGTLPLGAGCAAASLLAAGLARREEIFILEACVDDGEDELLRRIVENRPQVVGFSLYCWNSTTFAVLAERLKADFPEILLIAGGPDAERFVPERLKAEEPGRACRFDALFLGEAEASLPAWLAEAMNAAGAAGSAAAATGTKAARAAAAPRATATGMDARATAASAQGCGPAIIRRPAVIRGKPCDASSLPSPWLEGMLEPRRGGAVAWELTRGCPFRCAYCYEGRGFSGLRHFPAERLEKELELFSRSGVKEIFVLDPTFNTQGKRALSLLKSFAEKGGDMDWYFEIRAELLDRAQAEAFAAISCSLQIGLQSVRPEVLKNIGREMDRKKFASKVGLLNRTGAVFGLDLIYGLPGDTLSGFRESLDFALSLMPNHLDIFPLAVLPGTTLHGQSGEFALEFDSQPPYLVKGQPGFSSGDMDAAARLARACGTFYTKGRAVPWFLSILKPLRMSPSAFLAGFDTIGARGKAPPSGHAAIEALQCAYISRLYARQGKDALLPAALDLLRFHGAWSRAFADGEASRLKLTYPLHLVESPELLDIEYFRRHNDPHPCRVTIMPTEDGPRARILSKHE